MELIDKLIKEVPLENYKDNVRINISPLEYLKLLEIIKNSKENTEYLIQEISNKKTLVRRENYKKSNAANEATQVRVEKARKHIVDAIDYIKRNDIKLNQSNVAKHSKCSINTVRKYKYLFLE